MVERLSKTSAAGRLLYSVDEAAELLGIGRTFMFHLVATGEIDSFKIGKRRKIPRDALDSYIQRLRSEQLADAANPTEIGYPRHDTSGTSSTPTQRAARGG